MDKATLEIPSTRLASPRSITGVQIFYESVVDRIALKLLGPALDCNLAISRLVYS